jgi:hypothetical protein
MVCLLPFWKRIGGLDYLLGIHPEKLLLEEPKANGCA